MRYFSYCSAFAVCVSALTASCGLPAGSTPAAATVGGAAFSGQQLFDLGFAGLSATERGQAVAGVGGFKTSGLLALSKFVASSNSLTIDGVHLADLGKLTRPNARAMAATERAFPTLADLWRAKGVETALPPADFGANLDDMLHRMTSHGPSYLPTAGDLAVQANLLASLALAIERLGPAHSLGLGAFQTGQQRMQDTLTKLANCPTIMPRGGTPAGSTMQQGPQAGPSVGMLHADKIPPGSPNDPVPTAVTTYPDGVYSAQRFPNGATSASCCILCPTGDAGDAAQQMLGAVSAAVPTVWFGTN